MSNPYGYNNTRFDHFWSRERIKEGNSLFRESGTNSAVVRATNRGPKTSNPPYNKVGVFGWRDPSPYTNNVHEIVRTAGMYRETNPYPDDYTYDLRIGNPNNDDVRYGQSGGVAFDPDVPGVLVNSELESEAIAKAMAKLKDQHANLGEAVATLEQTYSMMRGAALTFTSALKALKQRNPSALIKVLANQPKNAPDTIVKGAAGRFLEYHYGWKPMMDDIKGYWDLLGDYQAPQPPILVGKGSARRSVEAVNGWAVDRTGGGYQSVFVKLYAKVTDTPGHIVDQLGLSNPLSLGWELVPWSFLIDWFVPVGAVLDTWLPPRGLEFLGGFCSTKCELSITSTYRPSPTESEITPRTNRHLMKGQRRTVYTDWPRAGFYAKNPTKTFSPLHGGVSFALLLQQLRSR